MSIDFRSEQAADKFAGCLVGLAVGDALGAPLEFKAPGSFTPLTDMITGGTFNLSAGQFTDDTSMALCLAESLFESGLFDPVDQMNRYVRWYRQGYLSSTGVCFDIGNTTRASLEEFERSGQAIQVEGGVQGSNGAIMRVAPVPMAFAGRPDLAIHLSGESARTTHNFRESVDSCRLLGALIVAALNGEEKITLITPGFSPEKGLWERAPLTPRVADISQGSFRQKNPPEIVGSGLSVECLEAALWAFYHSSNFEEGLLMAVNLGDDADSTGAVFGQIAGACYGLRNIPQRWVDRLWENNLVLDYANKLRQLACKISAES
jgi:ADP-ribosylglycohydrolase